MARLFGTDGVRGVAGDDLTGRLAMDLAVAAAEVLHETGVFDRARAEGRRPVAVVGRDPRASGEFLESAVVAGPGGGGGGGGWGAGGAPPPAAPPPPPAARPPRGSAWCRRP